MLCHYTKSQTVMIVLLQMTGVVTVGGHVGVKSWNVITAVAAGANLMKAETAHDPNILLRGMMNDNRKRERLKSHLPAKS